MKKIILSVFFIVYIFITLTITIFLTKYNDFGIIEFKNKLIVTSNKTDMNYRKGTLLIISKDDILSLKEKDQVFYYTADRHKILVSKDEIKEIEVVNDKEKTFILNNSRKYSNNYIIGKVNNLIKLPLIGYFIMFLTSKIGYLLFILLPILYFFILQIITIFKRKNEYEKE